MPDDHATPPSVSSSARRSGWQGRLELGFARRGDASILARRAHVGPLVVQKTLHPEGPEVCQAVIVHPPGGIAGGDSLQLRVDVAGHAHAQLVTPGAAKWYRSAANDAVQRVEFDVADGALLEWLPHESIVFDGALARTTTRLALSGSARALLWDVLCLGRTAAGERFEHGVVRQRVEVVRDDALLWVEQNTLPANACARASPVGLDGHCAFATFVAAAPCIDDAWLARSRELGSELAMRDHAVTRLPGVMIARARSASTASLHGWLRALWTMLRPLVLQRAAHPPRLWST